MPQTGDVPLHFASQKGNAAVVEQLLVAGAVTDVKTKVRRVGKAGWVEG